MKKLSTGFLLITLLISSTIFGQNVAINITGAVANTSAMLDVDATNKGLLIPRVALTATNSNAPIGAGVATSLLVYNTATASAGATAVTPGYYWWSGTQWMRLLNTNGAWQIGGNYFAGTGLGYIFGPMTNDHIDWYTNGVVRGRMSNLGEFFIGTTATALPGDLMNGVGNATFPWAVNGYSAFNGGAVYGQVTAGTTIFASVQGEYFGTNASGAGVRGIYSTNTAGTGFNATATGVTGTATTTGTYKFGVFGSGGTTTRSGGVMGYDYGLALGALGYYAFNGVDYAVYGFGQAYANGLGTGMLPSEFYKLHPELDPLTQPNNMIGIGIHGGVMGGWIKGLVYGTAFKGDKFGVYVDGKTITNSPVIELIDNNSETRTISYTTVSLTADINSKGRIQVNGGEAFIPFTDEFKQIIDTRTAVVNLTPMGNSNGFYVSNISPDGISIKENNNGASNLELCWSITATRKDVKQGDVSTEIASDKFDSKLDGLMFNDYNTKDQPTSLWWDGEKVRFDPIPEEVVIQIRGEKILDYNKQLKESTRGQAIINR